MFIRFSQYALTGDYHGAEPRHGHDADPTAEPTAEWVQAEAKGRSF